MKRSPMKRRVRNTGPDAATKALIAERSGGLCEISGTEPATEYHHRMPRGMGSSSGPQINSPSNLLHVSAAAHRYVETHRAEALIAGWLVSRYDNPARVPVLIHNGSRWVNLSATEARYLDPEEVPV